MCQLALSEPEVRALRTDLNHLIESLGAND